jgi:hypothetical protein
VQWATAQRTLLNATVGYRNYNPSAHRSPNDPRVQEIMGRGAAAATSRPLRRTWRRPGWRGRPARAHADGRHLGALAARDLLQRMSAADALKKASTEVDKVLKEAGIK